MAPSRATETERVHFYNFCGRFAGSVYIAGGGFYYILNMEGKGGGGVENCAVGSRIEHESASEAVDKDIVKHNHVLQKTEMILGRRFCFHSHSLLERFFINGKERNVDDAVGHFGQLHGDETGGGGESHVDKITAGIACLPLGN